MNLTPINDRVLVLPARAPMYSAVGLVLTPKAKNEPEQGVVIAAGPAASSGVYPGQRVVYAQGKHETARVDGQDLVVLRDEDLMAVVEP